ncbi:Diphthine--ammonia ligase [Liparis tanakae]|uniref:Diphthine--ammonia ligase n=1 Tax=Liparis tanakae TaxID=230148 RepID=A0A4Z2EXP8_9TELE|nr:Diphthine--ammonia ligase [Liparis tanakae]
MDVVARALPRGRCPCQNAIDKMTEEVEYADQAQDNQQEFTSNCDLSCQQGHGELDSRGWSMKDIVLVHLYVTSMEDFVALNAVYKEHFGVNPPARVCVQAPLPAGRLLQVDCLLQDWSAPPEEGCFHQREALHVQSLSHWAPANIGPYSQALRDSVRLRHAVLDPVAVSVAE